ncbi:hypothetical protein GLYMA_02G109300v4 [Glycine max]|nr:hypothetical protein GYH30_003667 [Glycine max]KRH70757.2 hypothetical protein GLYMA_02G109300v4 [Glycine max]
MNIKFQCFTVTSSTKMNLHCASLAATISSVCSINEATHKSRTLQKRVNSDAPIKLSTEFLSHDSLEPTTKPCFCGRRHFIEAATLGTTLFPIQPSRATNPPREYTALLKKFHPPRPDWYEEFYASVMNSATKDYEAEVGEAIPLSDASVDAVVGTLVLCSVKDVDMTLKVRRVLRPGGLYVFVEHVAAKDGTFLKFMQRVLDPLQQTLADGCHLSRETGNDISRAGFSSVELNTAFLSSATFINPHAYGIAYK